MDQISRKSPRIRVLDTVSSFGSIERGPVQVQPLELDPQQRSERDLKRAIKLSYGILLLWPFAFFASLMSGDAPGSDKFANNVVTGVLVAGVAPFVTHLAAQIVASSGRWKAANVIALLPIWSVLALAILMFASCAVQIVRSMVAPA